MYLNDCVGCGPQLGSYGYHAAGPHLQRRKVSHAKHGRGRQSRLILMPHAGGDLNEYTDDGRLGSWWTKIRDKVVVPVAHAAAAYVTGGASLAVSANILKSQAAAKAAKAQADQQAQVQREAIAAQERVAMATLTPNVAPAAAPITATPSTAPPASLVQQQMPTPQAAGMMPTFSTMFQPSASAAPQYVQMPPSGGQPPWLIPAAIGGGVLLLVMMGRNRPSAPAAA